MSDMDWKSALSSEVFREYLKIQVPKITQAKTQEDVLPFLEKLSELEMDIKDSPKKLVAFQALQNKFKNDPDYTAQVDPLFVEAILMLDLEKK